jgi:iron complex transport system ATP-binding protein
MSVLHPSQPPQPLQAPVSLDIQGLRAGFGLTTPFSARLEGPAVIGVIGPNGAGKSTLLRALLGVEPSAQGEVMINGRLLSTLSPHERCFTMSYLPQTPEGSPHWSLLELSAQGVVGMSGPARSTHALEALERVGLRERAHERLGTLSGGERRRAFLARTFAQRARVSLLDEPLAHLDWAHAEAHMRLIREESRRVAQLTLIALHDLNLAALYCDALISVCPQRGALVGAPQALLTEEHLSELFGEWPTLSVHPRCGAPLLLPHGPLYRSKRLT